MFPNQTAEFVTMQRGVVADRHVVGHWESTSIKIATQEQHPVGAVTADQLFAERRQESLGRRIKIRVGLIGQQRQVIGNDLERVVAGATEQQVTGVAVLTAGQYVVARVAEDPILTRPAPQDVVAVSTQNDVTSLDVLAKRETDYFEGIDFGFDLGPRQIKPHVVQRRNDVRTGDLEEINRVFGHAAQRHEVFVFDRSACCDRYQIRFQKRILDRRIDLKKCQPQDVDRRTTLQFKCPGGSRSGERERKPVHVFRIVDLKIVESRTPINRSHRVCSSQCERLRRFIVATSQPARAEGAFGFVDQDRIARTDFNNVVTGPGVNPNGLLDRRPDGDFVVTGQRVDDDDQEIAFGRQQTVDQ